MVQGVIFDIKEFTVHDGPGIRTTVFMKGCPLRCQWCHNPEGLSSRRQLMITGSGCTKCGLCRQACTHPDCYGLERCIHVCPKGLVRAVGEQQDAESLAGRLKKQAEYFKSGVTVSGGEPTMQPEFLLHLLEGLKGIHTVVETSGFTSEKIFSRVMENCSMIYLDIKHMDNRIHEELTGVSNTRILKNLELLMEGNREYVIRMPLIPGKNDSPQNLRALAEKLRYAAHPPKVEFLPYNPYTQAKYKMAGMKFLLEELEGESYAPAILEQIFKDCGVLYEIL